jgi:hypothetical protein
MPAVKRSAGPPPEKPADCDDATHAALKAIQTGTASAAQQQRALDWIIEKAAGTYDLPFRPGTDGARDTDFACGKMFVGQQIVRQLNTYRVTPKQPRTKP